MPIIAFIEKINLAKFFEDPPFKGAVILFSLALVLQIVAFIVAAFFLMQTNGDFYFNK